MRKELGAVQGIVSETSRPVMERACQTAIPAHPSRVRPVDRAYNHEALEACRTAVTTCRTTQPLVLVGAPGSGKSLLLSGLTRYARARRPEADLFTLSPERLAEGPMLDHALPARLDEGAAILFVDRLDSFEAPTETLVRVVRRFVERGHAVICTSTSPPALISRFPQDLREVFASARCIPITPVPIPCRVAAQMAGGVNKAPVAAARLHRLLTVLRSEIAKARTVEKELRAEIERERALTTALSNAFDTAREHRRRERREMHALYRELLRMRELLARSAASMAGGGNPDDALETVNAARLAAHQRTLETANALQLLKEENQRLHDEVETLVARIWELSASLAEGRARLDEADRLRRTYMDRLQQARDRRLAAEGCARAARARARDLETALRQAEEACAVLTRTPETADAPSGPQSADLETVFPQCTTGVTAATGAILESLVAGKAAADLRAEQAQRRLEDLETELIRTRMEMDALLQENGRRLDALDVSRERVALMERAFAEHETALLQWRDEAEAARRTAAKLYQDLKVVTLQRDDFQERLHETTRERDALACYTAQLRQKCGTLEVRLREALENQAASKAALEQHARAQAALHLEITGLHAALARMQQELLQALRRVSATAPPATTPANVAPFRPRASRARIGEILLTWGAVRKADLDEALEAHRSDRSRRLGVHLLERGHVSEETLTQALARQAGVLFTRLTPDAISTKALALISAATARKLGCIPLRVTSSELVVAMADPLDTRARREIEQAAHRRLRVIAAPPTDISQVCQVYYAA